MDLSGNTICGDGTAKKGPEVGPAKAWVCGKHATKWLKDVLSVNKSVENVTTIG